MTSRCEIILEIDASSPEVHQIGSRSAIVYLGESTCVRSWASGQWRRRDAQNRNSGDMHDEVRLARECVRP